MRNLEIKARVEALAPLRSRLRAMDGASRQPVVRQTDWYFRVPKGRLKLRVLGGRRTGVLIAYVRPDLRAVRTSDFQLMLVAHPASTRALLETMFGVRACVRKRREVWLYKNARIHLDSVEGLGTFVEVEVVVTAGMRQARTLMSELRGELEIRATDLFAGSYGELTAKR
jgi:predicted adenylyl cyclase CyaB